jgi:ribonuclease-3
VGLRPGEAGHNLLTEPPEGAELAGLERRLHLRFRDRGLLLQAVTHSSFVHEHPEDGVGDNERLEFLGDAMIHGLSAEMLYRLHPDASEGELTVWRAGLVSTGALAAAARRLQLGAHLRLGRGVERAGGRDLESLLANSLEAVFGAVYLDRGLAGLRRLFEAVAAPDSAAANHKGRLQEHSQALGLGTPEYRLVGKEGPGHRPVYSVEVSVGGRNLGGGEASTRRAAEQAAAQAALAVLDEEGAQPQDMGPL